MKLGPDAVGTVSLAIGLGVYPLASLDQILPLVPPRTPMPVLVMSTPTMTRHGIAYALREHRPDTYTVRRFYLPDNDQVDFTKPAEAEADRWYELIRDGLAPEQFRACYCAVVGINEVYDNNRQKHFPWLARFELRLATRVQTELGVPYFWGSIAPGNVDPLHMATTFKEVNQVAAGVCYHAYTKPGNKTLEGPEEPWYARRPWLWWQECQRRGVRFPALLLGETGPWYSWTEMAMNSEQIRDLLVQFSEMLGHWRAAGMPIVGQCLFSIGAEGDMGWRWNLSPRSLELVGQFNLGDVDRRPIAVAVHPQEVAVSESELERYAADIYARYNVPFNREGALTRYWLSQFEAGRFLGYPMEPEHPTENGRYIVQGFSSTILHVRVGDWGNVREGLPPLSAA